MFKGIVVGHNTGLGDQIVMNGGIRYLSQCYDKVWFITWENRAKHARFLYKDCENVEIYVKPSIKHSRQGVMRNEAAYREITESNPDYEFAPYKRYFWFDQKDWKVKASRLGLPEDTIFPRIFYGILGVPYSTRYDFQKIPRDFQIESELHSRLNIEPNEKYIFVANDSRSAKYHINIDTEKKIINPLDYPFWKDTLIYDWQTTIQLADEIHTVNTSWLHLIRSLKLSTPKFYYSAREVSFCEQNEEFLNDYGDSGWEIVKGNWKSDIKKKWHWT